MFTPSELIERFLPLVAPQAARPGRDAAPDDHGARDLIQFAWRTQRADAMRSVIGH